MKAEIVDRIVGLLAPGGVMKRSEIEARFPARQLPAAARVTRMCPSPTGFVHIGSIFTALIDDFLAHQSGGTMILRIEDTDKKREVAGALELILKQFAYFELKIDEGPGIGGEYGPYLQSERGPIYMAYAVELLKAGRAYPCFATPGELEENLKKQNAAKVRPGYYGEWALWRERSDEEIAAALDKGLPFVLRFRSSGSHEKRVQFEDAIRGKLEFPENDLDVPLLKTDEYRLPTYHFAHVVDDHLMRPTILVRGEEWLPSTPLHIDIARALGVGPFTYAHLGVISVLDNGNKRKLSKRKDPEANVAYFVEAGYPVKAVKAYLLGLANSNFEDWFRTHSDSPLEDFELTLSKLAQSRSPLLDMKKLDDISRDFIGNLPQDQYVESIISWAKEYNYDFYTLLAADPAYTKKVLAIEREGGQKRKDLAKWSDAVKQYSYFFEGHESRVTSHELSDIAPEDSKQIIEKFLESYDPGDNRDIWFAKVKDVAEAAGFAREMRDYKENPDKYKGSVADAARILRVKLTGRNRSPDLWTVMQVMGAEKVAQRLQN